MQDACPSDWINLPVPEGRIVIGLDGGYIRDRDDRKKNFERIVGCSLPEDGGSRYIGFVNGYDCKPQRRILDHLMKQAFRPIRISPSSRMAAKKSACSPR